MERYAGFTPQSIVEGRARLAGSSAYDRLLHRRPELATPAFEEFVVVHNRDDRDSGELSDISAMEITRLEQEWDRTH